MPLEYPGGGVVAEHTAVRDAVGVFDVSHLGKASVVGPGAADFVNATLANDLRRIGPGPGAVHALLRRRDRRRGRRPDRLRARRRRRAAGAQRRQHRRGGAAAGRGGARRRRGHRPAPRVRRARRPGPAVGRGARRPRAAGRARLHVVRRDRLARSASRRLPHRVHRRARVRAAARAGTTPARCGTRWSRRSPPAAGGPPASARATPCAPRWGTPCTGTSSRSTSRRCRRAWAGPWGGRRTPSGAATRCSPRSRPVRAGCCGGCRRSTAASRGPTSTSSTTAGRWSGRTTSGTFSPTLKQGIALALLPPEAGVDDELSVDVRGRRLRCRVVKPPFVQVQTRQD